MQGLNHYNLRSRARGGGSNNLIIPNPPVNQNAPPINHNAPPIIHNALPVNQNAPLINRNAPPLRHRVLVNGQQEVTGTGKLAASVYNIVCRCVPVIAFVILGFMGCIICDMMISIAKEIDSVKAQTAALSEDYSRILTHELAKYDADKTGLMDFALESAGGRIVSIGQTKRFPREPPTVTFFGLRRCQKFTDPSVIIQPQTLTGNCWPFRGSTGVVVIRLAYSVSVTGVSVEHIAKSQSPTGRIDNAPQNFTIEGLDGPDEHEGFNLGTFTYDENGKRLQHFEIPTNLYSQPFKFIAFRVLSNYGHPSFTCIYRVRVHGHVVNDIF